MLSYLQGLTRPDISMEVHQCARFSNYPRLIHERAVQKIGKYLSETDTSGKIYDPDKTQGIECYVYADFAWIWDRDNEQRAENFLSQSGYAIFYAGCPVLWVTDRVLVSYEEQEF